MCPEIGSLRALRIARGLVATIALVLLASATARAQGPQFDAGAPPGAAGGSSTVGQPLGGADFPDYGSPSITPFSGRPGPAGSHVPAASQSTPGTPNFRNSTRSRFAVQTVPEANVPAYGDLDLPEKYEGPSDGMTIDEAIETLIRQNLDLVAYRMEVPMAEADVLTANLRANPIFYADTQLIPYGHFSFLRPGGPPQSDVNINYPLDISFKRTARTRSARAAKKVTEAQLQDAVRNQIDNLYTVYVDAVAAALTVKFSETYAKGMHQLVERTQQLYNAKNVPLGELLAVRAKLELAELQVREAEQARIKANRALALMLNMPLENVRDIKVRDTIGMLRQSPLAREDLIQRRPGHPAGSDRVPARHPPVRGRYPARQGQRLPRRLRALSSRTPTRTTPTWASRARTRGPWASRPPCRCTTAIRGTLPGPRST